LHAVRGGGFGGACVVVVVGGGGVGGVVRGDGAAQRRLRLHKTLAWIHGAGMVLLPLLGIISANPQILGATTNEARAEVGRAMRSLHAIVGYTTFTAFTIAAAIEL
jgi:hypothetical protein